MKKVRAKERTRWGENVNPLEPIAVFDNDLFKIDKEGKTLLYHRSMVAVFWVWLILDSFGQPLKLASSHKSIPIATLSIRSLRCNFDRCEVSRCYRLNNFESIQSINHMIGFN